MMQSIKEIKEYLEQCSLEELHQAVGAFETDERKGVQLVVASALKRRAAFEKEQLRLDALLEYERACYAQGFDLVAGVDEVGRGPLAGPVVAAAVILPKNCLIEGVDDSKKLSAKKRESLYEEILEKAVSYGIGVVSWERIDEINILQATYEAMREALTQLNPVPRFILADAVTIPEIFIPQKGIIKGDAKSLSIGAASIVAKVYRDRLMEAYEALYPGYGFASNKGYGSTEHIAGIRVHGLCPIHRKSFVKKFANPEDNQTKGAIGEEMAVKEMRRLGYEILARNYRIQGGEIDIIAKKDTYIIFTEVKYRAGRKKGEPCEAVNQRKQEHIIRTAKAYIAEYALDGDFRFDVAEVLEENGKTFFRYTENAFWIA
ncbi:MAG: ribonuclease HII [Anaerotignum propionicum]|nr:ribonuclease HII [Anaerotignum propionicum]